MEEAVALFENWARARLSAFPGAAIEVVRLPGRTPVILIDIPARAPTPFCFTSTSTSNRRWPAGRRGTVLDPAPGEKFPQPQFIGTGVLGPHSNAHGPNEFLHSRPVSVSPWSSPRFRPTTSRKVATLLSRKRHHRDASLLVINRLAEPWALDGWRADMVTLQIADPLGTQQPRILRAFDAFRNGGEAEASGKTQQMPQKHSMLRADGEVLHKRAVDLHNIHGQTLQVA